MRSLSLFRYSLHPAVMVVSHTVPRKRSTF
jgi:hypothetical protein